VGAVETVMRNDYGLRRVMRSDIRCTTGDFLMVVMDGKRLLIAMETARGAAKKAMRQR
jgi:hypothetical protein